MPLTLAKLAVTLSWETQKTITGFRTASYSGPLAVTISPTVGASDAREIYHVQSTLAAGASVTFSVRTFTDPVYGASITGTGAYIVVVYGTGSTWKFEPGAANPLEWFLSGTTPAISGTNASVFCYGADDATTVSGTDDTLKITNTSGSDTLTYTFAVVVKTA